MEKGEGRREGRGETVRVAMSMVLVQVFQTGMGILSKLAFDQGMPVLPFLAYRYGLGALSVACLAFFRQRDHTAKLTRNGLMWTFLNALFGLTLGVSFFFYGIRDTTAAYSTIFFNLLPVVTFILSVIMRSEKIGLTRLAGILKVAGTLVCFGGALIISLYKGKAIHVRSLHFDVLKGAGERTAVHEYAQGTMFLVASCFCLACWFNLQGKVVKAFPNIYWGTSLTCILGCFQSAIGGMVVNHKLSEWLLTTKLQLFLVFYSGLLNVGATFILMTWAVSKRGPTFPSMFNPLFLIFVTIIESLFMDSQIFVGSIVGMIIIIAGIYAFLWGKMKEDRVTANLQKSTSSLGTSITDLELHQSSLQTSPNSANKSEIVPI